MYCWFNNDFIVVQILFKAMNLQVWFLNILMDFFSTIVSRAIRIFLVHCSWFVVGNFDGTMNLVCRKSWIIYFVYSNYYYKFSYWRILKDKSSAWKFLQVWMGLI